MEKRNTLLLTVIAIATLLVAVVGATFAYFASQDSVNINNGSLPVNANVGNVAKGNEIAFIASSESSINLNITGEMMAHKNIGTEGNTSNNEEVANNLTGNANINVSLDATNSSTEVGMTCKYDLVWTWDDQSATNNFVDDGWTDKASDNPIYPSKYYVRTQDTWATGYKELTLTIEATPSSSTNSDTANLNGQQSSDKQTIIAEKNIDEFNELSGSGSKEIVLKTGESIYAKSTKAEADYVVTVKFYNLSHDQTTLAEKNFVGKVSVANVKCD